MVFLKNLNARILKISITIRDTKLRFLYVISEGFHSLRNHPV